MNEITVEHEPASAKLEVMGVYEWPIWTKEASEFPWTYDMNETCYLLEGEVIVTPEGGEAVVLKKGDLVNFPAGMSCHWHIRSPVKKHYKFS